MPSVGAIALLANVHANDVVSFISFQALPPYIVTAVHSNIIMVSTVPVRPHISPVLRQQSRRAILLHKIPFKSHSSDMTVIGCHRNCKRYFMFAVCNAPGSVTGNRNLSILHHECGSRLSYHLCRIYRKIAIHQGITFRKQTVDGGFACQFCHLAAHKLNTIFCTIRHGHLTNIAAIRQRQLCTFLNRQALKCAI